MRVNPAKEWLKKWARFPNGIPVTQTMINLFSLLDPEQFSQCITAHNDVAFLAFCEPFFVRLSDDMMGAPTGSKPIGAIIELPRRPVESSILMM